MDDGTDPSHLTLSSDDAVEAISELAGLARNTSVSLSPEQLREQDAVDWFAAGKLGMFVGTRDDLPRLRDTKGLRFDVLTLPSLGRATSVSSINGYCINARSERVDEATDFVAFAVGPEGAKIIARSGVMVPSNVDIVHEDVFLQPGRLPRSGHVYASAIRRSEALPYSADWDAAAGVAEQQLERIWTRPGIDLETVQRRLERLDTRSEEIFGGAD